MFKNYFIIAIRNFTRYKLFTLINVLGLAIGFACSILILLFILHELSYDQFHENAHRIYRIVRETQDDAGQIAFGPGTSSPLASALKAEFPEVEEALRVWISKNPWVTYKNTVFQQTVCLADPNFLEVFSFPLLKGNAQTVLQHPQGVVVTRAMAQKFFGDQDPIDKTLEIRHRYYKGAFNVVGVLDDLPPYSSLSFDFLISSTALEPSGIFRHFAQRRHWYRPFNTYVLLRDQQAHEVIEEQLPNFMARHFEAETVATDRYHLQPLQRIHLYSQEDYGPNWYVSAWDTTYDRADIVYVYVFAAIAGLILLLACVNFTNLATALSITRVKEVGIRKVVGANKKHLIQQFLGESIILVGFGLLLGLSFVELTKFELSNFWNKPLSLVQLDSVWMLTGLLCFVICIGFLAGSYPAFFCAAFQPLDMMRGRSNINSVDRILRKGLVIFQFTISIGLMICTAIVYAQVAFLRTQNLGYDPEELITIPIFLNHPSIDDGTNERLAKNYNQIKQAFQMHPDVLSVSASRQTIAPGPFRIIHINDDPNTKQSMPVHAIDEDYFETYKIPIVAGRNFSKDIPTDMTSAFILNEAAVEKLGLEHPIGTPFAWGRRNGLVIGVVKNFHTRSLHYEITPVAFNLDWSNFCYITLRIRTKNINKTLAFLEDTWNRLNPTRPFDYAFVEEEVDLMYRSEKQLGMLFTLFSGIAIFLACSGLFGLTAFAVQQRIKEIGIRKILGASTSTIIWLLSKESLFLVFWANLVAWPVAYYVMDRWLRVFSYHIEPGIDIFFTSALIAFFIVLLTVSYHAFKTAQTDPVNALRHE